MGRFVITLTVILTGILLIFSVSAESTFFDNSNDAFVMGPASAARAIDSSTPRQQNGDSGGGNSCPSGYNLTQGKCVNITKINITPSEPEEGANKTKEFEEAEERQLMVNEPSAIPSMIDRKKVWYTVLAAGIMLLVIVYVLFFRRKKKRPPITTKAYTRKF